MDPVAFASHRLHDPPRTVEVSLDVGVALTIGNRERVERAALSALHSGQAVRLDFTGTRHLDAAGISLLLRLRGVAQTYGTRVMLAGVGGDSAAVLSITGVLQFFPDSDDMVEVAA